MIKVSEAVIVEGKYDKIKLSPLIDGLIIDVGGFRVFKDKKMINLIRKLAVATGILILTDSDNAGFMIRNYIKGSIKVGTVKHAYIPDVYGKERRKFKPSKEGKLGVEGMNEDVLLKIIESAVEVKIEDRGREPQITKIDLYCDGFSGSLNSKEKRRKILKQLNLPEHLTVNAMLPVLNSIMTYSEYKHIVSKI